jgi:hypothetical protein
VAAGDRPFIRLEKFERIELQLLRRARQLVDGEITETATGFTDML